MFFAGKLRMRVISATVAIVFLVNSIVTDYALANTNVQGGINLAPLLASQSSIIKSQIEGILFRSGVVYAESDSAKQLLEINGAEALLLKNGKYLVTKEVAENNGKLIKAVYHEGMESLMQILYNRDRKQYEKIKNFVKDTGIDAAYERLKGYKIEQEIFSPRFNGRWDLVLNDILATTFEMYLFYSQGFLNEKENEQIIREKIFYDEIKVFIEDAKKIGIFDEKFFDMAKREDFLHLTLNLGFRFEQAASTTNIHPGAHLSKPEVQIPPSVDLKDYKSTFRYYFELKQKMVKALDLDEVQEFKKLYLIMLQVSEARKCQASPPLKKCALLEKCALGRPDTRKFLK